MFSFDDRERMAVIVRELRGDMTLRQMGKILGVSATTIRAWEHSEATPMIDQLEMIAQKKSWSLPYLYYQIKGTKPTVEDCERLIMLLNEEERFLLYGSVVKSMARTLATVA